VVHEAIAECVTDVVKHFNETKKKILNGVVYAFVLHLIIRKTQSKCDNNLTYHINTPRLHLGLADQHNLY